MAQLPAFQYCTAEPLFIECTVQERQWLTFAGQPLELSLVLIHVFSCMLIMHFFPKIPKVGKWIPASLVGLLVGTLFEWTLFRKVIGQGTRTVSSRCLYLWIQRQLVAAFAVGSKTVSKRNKNTSLTWSLSGMAYIGGRNSTHCRSTSPVYVARNPSGQPNHYNHAQFCHSTGRHWCSGVCSDPPSLQRNYRYRSEN